MAIVFSEEKKRQQYLIVIFAVVVLATVAVFWFGVFQAPKTEVVQIPTSPFSKKVEINFSTLDDPRLADLELFSGITAFAGETGRANPFAP